MRAGYQGTVRTVSALAFLAAVFAGTSSDRTWLVGALGSVADGRTQHYRLGIVVGVAWIVVGCAALAGSRALGRVVGGALGLAASGLALIALWSAPALRSRRSQRTDRYIEGDPWNVLVRQELPGFHDGWFVGTAVGFAVAAVVWFLDRRARRSSD